LSEPEVLTEAPAAPEQIDHFVLDQEDLEISETEERAAGQAENAVHFESMAKSIVVEKESFNEAPSFAPAAAGNVASADMVVSRLQEKPVSVVNESLLDLLFAAR
jgi:hypothetical protein